MVRIIRSAALVFVGLAFVLTTFAWSPSQEAAARDRRHHGYYDHRGHYDRHGHRHHRGRRSNAGDVAIGVGAGLVAGAALGAACASASR